MDPEPMNGRGGEAPESGLSPTMASMSRETPPSLLILCPVPKTPAERVFLERILGETVRAAPGLLRTEILWVGAGSMNGVGKGTGKEPENEAKKETIKEKCPAPPPDLFPGIPSALLRVFPASREFIPALRSFLKGRPFDLVEPRLLERSLCRKIQSAERSAVPGETASISGPARSGETFLPGFYRTLVRTRAFRGSRKGISLLRSAAGSLLSRPAPAPGTLRILMYHRVAETMETDILAVTPFAFAQQMRWLREEGWSLLPLPEALRRLESGTLPPKAAAITFDDGYRDNYDEAAPVLAGMHFPATVFPVTAFVLEEAEHRRYRGRDPKVPYLTVEQIRQMKRAGFDFGGHTHTHPLLSMISCEEAQEEILRAKKLLEEWTGEKSTLFAYPNGIYGKEHFRILDALGYEAALTVRPGANRPGTYRFALLRTEVSGRDSLGDFIRKMNGGFDLIHRVTQSVRGFYR
jgi:peptidoglycan/xylan/chitin deacetylase (PgdA/CDA1 family)